MLIKAGDIEKKYKISSSVISTHVKKGTLEFVSKDRLGARLYDPVAVSKWMNDYIRPYRERNNTNKAVCAEDLDFFMGSKEKTSREKTLELELKQAKQKLNILTEKLTTSEKLRAEAEGGCIHLKSLLEQFFGKNK